MKGKTVPTLKNFEKVPSQTSITINCLYGRVSAPTANISLRGTVVNGSFP